MIMIHPTIETLRRLRLTGMAKALEEQQGLPDCDRLSFDERLAMLVDREAVERDNAALAQRLRLAKLRQAAFLEDVDYRTPRGLDRSLIPIERWHDASGDPTYADAILDRLVHNAYRIELRGDSMRRRKPDMPGDEKN